MQGWNEADLSNSETDRQLPQTPIFGSHYPVPVGRADVSIGAVVVRGDENPAAVYLSRLAPSSRRVMAQALRLIAALFGQPIQTVDWAGWRYQHTAALRAHLLRRDAALLAVLYGLGLRRTEAVSLDLADYNAEAGEVRVRCGKGRKQRIAYVIGTGKAALAEWLAVRGPEPGPLFWAANGRGRPLVRRRPTPEALLLLLRRRARLARVAALSPHDLRRTFISDLVDAGADLMAVQQLAGHANIGTTSQYDRRPEQARRRAAELLVLPFVPVAALPPGAGAEQE